MQISKSTHLMKLLRTQDVCFSMFAFLLATHFAYFAEIISSDSVISHIALLPFILLVSWVAARGTIPGLHGRRMIVVAYLAARFAALIVISVLAIAYFGKLEFISRYLLSFYGAMLALTILANRLFLRWWYFSGRREHPDNFLQVLVIGSGNRAKNLVQAYQNNTEWGIRIVGMLDPVSTDHSAGTDDAPFLGDTSIIRQVLTEQVIDEVVICLPRSLLDNAADIVDVCAEEAVVVKFLADLYEVPGAEYKLQEIGSWPVLGINPVARQESALIIKRIADLLLTIPALLVLTPLLIITAIAIKADSQGSVFFKQRRIGLNKREFNMIKFRSMHKDAEKALAELEHLNEADGPIFKMKNDPRITRVGRFIRRTSIDELPQLFNVLLGQMSLIGPRPMSQRDVDLFSKGVQRARFSVRPGLACLREVSGRSALSFDQWLELDLKYIDEWTLWLDVKILFLLIPAVLRGDGAS